MLKYLFIAVVFACTGCHQKHHALSYGAQLLFDTAHYYTTLTLADPDKEAVFKMLKLGVDKEKKMLYDLRDDSKNLLTTDVRIIDLNRDGKPEVFVSLYNFIWTGQGGHDIACTKTDTGFRQIMRIQGYAGFLTTSHNGYPDIICQGPGMQVPCEKWDGTRYVYYKMQPFAGNATPEILGFADYYQHQAKEP